MYLRAVCAILFLGVSIAHPDDEYEGCTKIMKCIIGSGERFVIERGCHTLNCVLSVRDKGILEIQPGTTVLAIPTDNLSDQPVVIVVQRGGTIYANGSAELPITFSGITGYVATETVVEDKLNLNAAVNQYPFKSLQINKRGIWGGVVIAGRAPLGGGESVETIEVEGITGIIAGGSLPQDSSGVLRYVRIWHTGYVLSEGNELNGLTLAGVGNGTQIENIEIAHGRDDGVELFGGTVNIHNIIVINVEDDAVDLDYGYSGNISSVFIVRHGFGEAAIEIGGCLLCGNSNTPFTLSGITIVDDGFTGTKGTDSLIVWKTPEPGTIQSVTSCGTDDSPGISLIEIDCSGNVIGECTENAALDPVCRMRGQADDSDSEPTLSYMDPVACPSSRGAFPCNEEGSQGSSVVDLWANEFSILVNYGLLPKRSISNIASRLPCGNISDSLELDEGTTWLLRCPLAVIDGGSLSLGAGVSIYATVEDFSSAELDKATTVPAIVILSGGLLISNGTTDHPVTFTSALPDFLLPYRGAWGGVTIAGTAPIVAEASFASSAVVEGFASFVTYGGIDHNDSSGYIVYTRIWYGGRRLGEGFSVELNGLTLAGVGNGTLIQNIDVSYSLDDGIELFGGTVNLRYVSVIGALDDGVDFAEGYSGYLQFIYVLMLPDSSLGIESTGIGISSLRTFPVVRSLTLDRVGITAGRTFSFFKFDKHSSGRYSNMILNGFSESLISIDDCEIGTAIGQNEPDSPQILWVSPNTLVIDAPEVEPIHWWNEECKDIEDPSLFIKAQYPVLIVEETAVAFPNYHDPRPFSIGGAYQNLDEIDPTFEFFVQTDFKGAFDADMESFWLCNVSILAPNSCNIPDPQYDKSSQDTALAVGITVMCLFVLGCGLAMFFARYRHEKQAIKARKPRLTLHLESNEINRSLPESGQNQVEVHVDSEI